MMPTNVKTAKIDKTAAICGMIWFVLIIDACFTWFMPETLRDFMGTMSVLLATVILIPNNGIVIKRNTIIVLASLSVIMLYMVLVKFIVFSFFVFFPLTCFVCWRQSALAQMYVYFRNFVVFYAIVSIIAELFVVSHLWVSIPHSVLPPQDFVQENLGYDNYFYGLFCIPAPDTSINFYRACGPLREGGHWIFFLGFVYFVEKAIYNKRNIWLMICGLLTLSPNFVALFILTEIYTAITQKKILKPIITMFGGIFLILFIFVLLPQTIKDSIIQIIYERLLESSIENVDSEGIMAILDGRTVPDGLLAYDRFVSSPSSIKMFGFQSFKENEVLSDFRYYLMLYGYIGTILSLWCTYLFSLGKERGIYGLSILIIALLCFAQRAWMFNHVYVWVMMILSVNMNSLSPRYIRNQ